MLHVPVGNYECYFTNWTPDQGRIFDRMFAYDTETTEDRRESA